MLNYAYAILESRERSEIVAHGYDPYDWVFAFL
ncbi:hypothetical protein [Bradyrhizobium sp. 2S1]